VEFHLDKILHFIINIVVYTERFINIYLQFFRLLHAIEKVEIELKCSFF